MATDKAITYLKNKAPKGEFLAYINKKEAAMLKKAGGSGELVNGIPSYRSKAGMDSKASSNKSSSKSSSKGGGGGNLGGGGGGQNTTYRSYRAPTKKTYTSKTIDSKPVTGNDYRDSRQQFIDKVNKDNRIAAAQNNTRFTPYQGGSRMQRSPGGLGNLLKLAIGGAFPGAGLLMGGLNKFGKMGKGIGEGITSLNDKIQNSAFGRSTSLMDYLDSKKYGGIDARDRKADQTMREAREIQTAMDMRPTTLDPREMARMGLQMPTAPRSKPTFSDPFANTVGTTTKVNAPSNDAVSSVTRDYSGIEDYGVDINPLGPGRGFLESLGFTPGHTAAIDAMDKNFNGSQFDYSAAATKDMVNRASNPLTAALSAIGNVAGRPFYDAVDAAKEYSKKGYQGEFSFSPQGAVDFGKNLGVLGKEFLDQKPGTMMAGALTGGLQALSDRFSNPFISSAAAAEVRPAIGMESTPFGSMPTGDVGLNASGRLGNLSATVDAIDALKGESVDPQINYSGNFGNTTAYGNFSDDVQNLGLNFNNDKGLSGGISYDAITGEPRFDIGFRRTFADGGLASMFTRRR